MRVFNRHFNIKGRTKLFGLFKKNEAGYSYFQRRGIGVAMDNAVQEVKDIADDITLSNEEDGVAAYLEKWII